MLYSVALAHGLARRARDISWSRSWSAIAHRQELKAASSQGLANADAAKVPQPLLGAELLQDACVVVQSPVLHDDSIREAVEDHSPEVDVLASWSNALELPFMRPLVPHVIRDPVVFRDECLDRCVEVWERRPPCSNLLLRVFRQLATRLVDDIEDAAVERLIHVSPNVRFVRLGLSGRHQGTKSCPV